MTNYEPCSICEEYIEDVICDKDKCPVKKMKSEIEDLFYKLSGVMHYVDKWLDGDELKQDEVNRAMLMREKTLQMVENLEKENKEIWEERCRIYESLQEAKAENEKLNFLLKDNWRRIEELDKLNEKKVNMTGFNKDVEYLRDWNKDLALTNDEQEAIDVHNRCIRAYELLTLCFSLLERQQHSPYVLNLLEEILVDGDGDECDGGYVFEEIENLLIESGELTEEEE